MAPAFYIAGMDEPLLVQSFFILRFLSGRDSVQSHRPIPGRHRCHLFGVLETFSTITLNGAGCFVSKAMARICISAKSIFPPVVEKMLMVAGASPALVSSLLIRSDQLRRSMFGFRSASSTLAAQWSILRFVVQPSYRSSSPRCALLRVHHQGSSMWAGHRYYPRFSVSLRKHRTAFMAPALSTGMFVGVSTAPAGMPQPCIAPQFQPAMQANSHNRSAAFVCRASTCCQSNLAVIDLPQIWNPLACINSITAGLILCIPAKSPASGGGVTSRPALFAAYSASFAAWDES